MACWISCSVAFGFLSRNALAVMITPLMQKPHCVACSSMNACCRGCGFSMVPKPSRVVISAPSTLFTGVTQERIACAFTITVQAPHCPSPHPNFGPFSARSSLSTYKSGVVGSTSTAWTLPLTFKFIALIEFKVLPGPVRRQARYFRRKARFRPALRLQDGPANSHDGAPKCRVGHFRERKIERIESREHPNPADRVAPRQSHAQVASRKQKERDPQQQEDGPERDVGAKRRDPHR